MQNLLQWVSANYLNVSMVIFFNGSFRTSAIKSIIVISASAFTFLFFSGSSFTSSLDKEALSAFLNTTRSKEIDRKKDAAETIRYIDYARERGYSMLELLKFELTCTSAQQFGVVSPSHSHSGYDSTCTIKVITKLSGLKSIPPGRVWCRWVISTYNK